ncbi:putative LRR receptor-like serine/threonine-protein kinase [Iris pallida]|uniref:non-specific serine/threonine protein kinase n=1 Tax=Iris pallida TaxID=29817 RepID=A0AAX6DGT6_IRIPA|nr:putative LRR receptor-like serine/threonine-protein kinase [Iris pallida]
MELLPSLFRATKFIIVLFIFSYYPQPAMSKPRHNNLTDLESLLAFRASASDPYGILATNWTTGASLCSWIGVVCSQRRQRVTKLALDSFSLEGTISPHIANLSFLYVIRLSNNSLTGTIPDGIGRLPRLARLIIEKNFLSGPIPRSIFNMSSLTTLALTYNSLTGPLPSKDSLVLPQLRIMYLSSNMLTGRIPSGLARCTLLQGLSLSINEFSGSIPAELGNLTALDELYLGRNHLTGTISNTIGNLTGLYELDVSTNRLQGVIPEELGNLLHLQRLSLDNNTLTGSIPLALLNASNLDFVQLAGNHLTGSVPAALGKYWPRLAILTMEQNQLTGGLDFITSLTNCKELKLLDMSENGIRGVLPNSITNLSAANLEYIYAWQNFIRGEIPAGIGNLSNLLRVELGLNELDGSIPTTLSGLKRLQGLTLQDNKLSGSIPSELGMMVSLSELHLEINTLSGAIPHSIGNLSKLQHLVLGDNKLVSEIPRNLWSLTGLIELSLSGNSLSGILPQQVGNLKALDTLYPSGNRLSGNISSALGELQMIRELDVSKNSFQGEIPQSLGRLINVEYLNLSYNFLSGSIPKYLANLRYLASLDCWKGVLEGEIPQGRVFSNLSIPSLKGNAALCGGAPALGFPPCSSSVLPSYSKMSKLSLLKYTLPPLLFIFLLSSVYLISVCCRRSTKPMVPISNDTSLNNHRVISHHELVRATDNFNDANLIGRGSVSSVFKACLDDGSLAAVKVLNAQVQGAPGSFDAECHALSMIRHRNLIKIISVCSNSEFKALVLEYMANGSLEMWLHSPAFYLNLLQRINVMVDVSLALEYLHHHHPHIVVHRDVKPGNVLLDENMMAHVGDFGIAKLFLGDSTAMLSASAQGTIGYMPPEYGYRGKVSRKGDVYSFGILLLETFTRRRPSDAMFGGDLSLKKWVSDAYPHAVLEIVDSDIFMEGSTDERPEVLDTVQHCLSSIIELGLLCSRDSPKERLLMSDVVPILHKIKMEYLSKLSGS